MAEEGVDPFIGLDGFVEDVEEVGAGDSEGVVEAVAEVGQGGAAGARPEPQAARVRGVRTAGEAFAQAEPVEDGQSVREQRDRGAHGGGLADAFKEGHPGAGAGQQQGRRHAPMPAPTTATCGDGTRSRGLLTMFGFLPRHSSGPAEGSRRAGTRRDRYGTLRSAPAFRSCGRELCWRP
nr:hypothetical protein [Actinomadura sp. J1-007]